MENLQPAMSDNQNQSTDVKNTNLWQRIVGVIISPEATMKSIVQKPKVLFPILAMAIGPVAASIIRYPLYKEMQRDILIKTSETMAVRFDVPVMTAEQIDKSLSTNLITGLISSPIMSVIMWLIGTAILFGILKAFGGQGKYKQYLAVTGYAYVVTLISYLLTLIVSFVTNSLKLDLSLGIFAGQLLSGNEGSFMYGMVYTLLASIGIFTIWNYAVTAIGLVQLTQISKAKVFSVVIVIALVTILFQGALSGVTEVLTSGISAIV